MRGRRATIVDSITWRQSGGGAFVHADVDGRRRRLVVAGNVTLDSGDSAL